MEKQFSFSLLSKKVGIAILKGLWFLIRGTLSAVFLVIPLILFRLLMFCLTFGAYVYAPRTTSTVIIANELRKKRQKRKQETVEN